jgi:hypothetical protein
MTESHKRYSVLGRLSAGVKAVALIAVLGTIALAAVASHRVEVNGLAPNAMRTTSAPDNTSASAPRDIADYLGQAANAAAELPSAH